MKVLKKGLSFFLSIRTLLQASMVLSSMLTSRLHKSLPVYAVSPANSRRSSPWCLCDGKWIIY